MSVFPTPAFQVAHFRAGCILEAEQIRFLRIRAIEPRTNHEQRTNKEKELGRKFVFSQL